MRLDREKRFPESTLGNVGRCEEEGWGEKGNANKEILEAKAVLVWNTTFASEGEKNKIIGDPWSQSTDELWSWACS